MTTYCVSFYLDFDAEKNDFALLHDIPHDILSCFYKALNKQVSIQQFCIAERGGMDFVHHTPTDPEEVKRITALHGWALK